MRYLTRLILVSTAIAAAGCSSTTTQPPVVITDPPPAAAPTTQGDWDRLRAENARLRAQLTGVTQENTTIKSQAAVVAAKEKQIESGKLEVGMTLPEANKALNGSANIYHDTCRVIEKTDNEWTYRIFTGDPGVGGPGSGGAGGVGTNMRSGMTIPVQSWLCTFDIHTAQLVRFQRERK